MTGTGLFLKKSVKNEKILCFQQKERWIAGKIDEFMGKLAEIRELIFSFGKSVIL